MTLRSKHGESLGWTNAGMRCGEWGCQSCIELKKQDKADLILHGIEEIGAKEWHVAGCSVDDWRGRTGAKLSCARAHYFRIKYDGLLLTVADRPMPGSEPSNALNAWNRAVERLTEMKPDRVVKGTRHFLEKHVRGVSFSRN